MSPPPSRFFFLVLILLVFLLFAHLYTGRDLRGSDIVKKALEKGEKVSTYYTLIETAISAGQSTSHYFVEVWFSSPDSYRVEMWSDFPGAGEEPEQIFVSNGMETWIYSPELGDFYKMHSLSRHSAPPPFLLSSFLNDLSLSPEVEMQGIEKKDNRSCYVLRIISPSPGQNYAWRKVWLEKRTLLPVQINIYDINDRQQQEIYFHQTVINPEIDGEIFSTGRRDPIGEDNGHSCKRQYFSRCSFTVAQDRGADWAAVGAGRGADTAVFSLRHRPAAGDDRSRHEQRG